MPPDANELLESLQSAATTDSEHEFIRLRMEGYKNTEIAQALSITTTDVSRLRKTLMRHFNEAS
jgi:transcriptional regulator